MQEVSPKIMDTLDEPTKHQRRHRRSKKGGRNRRPDDPDPAAPGPIHVRRRKSSQSREGASAVYLRPTNVPLLNAPRNSTQFIIDDHENSNLFWNFEGGPGDHNHPGMAVFPGQYFHDDDDDFSPDDDNFWTEYSVRDFQSVYATAHQEEIAAWDRMKIIEEISSLERKQKELVDFIVRLDPELYLKNLQNQLLNLQEENRQLRVEKQELSPVLPDSTNTEDLEEEESGSPAEESRSPAVQEESRSPLGGQS